MVDEEKDQPSNFEELYQAEKKRSEEYLSRLKYLQADFENQKKRFDRETEQIKAYCSERIVLPLLEVVDELELAVKAGYVVENPPKGLLEGVELTLKKLRKVLEQEGVSPIDCEKEKTFNPALHNAIAAEQRSDVKGCVITEQIRKGYTLKGKVIRPSIVKVAVNSEENKNQSNQMEEKKK